MMMECNICHRYFWNEDGFFRCWLCLKTEKKWTKTKSDEFLEVQMKEFDLKYRQLLKEQKDREADKKKWEKEKKTDTRAEEKTRTRARPITNAKMEMVFNEEIQKKLKDLIRLCHPDKHGEKQKELAQDITQWLLEMKRR